jgi:ethanolaminephosphotransferase
MTQRLLEKVKGRFITQEGLNNLSQYKYSGEDNSLIYNYVINPFAKFVCNCLPRTIAPNVLTLLGLLCSAAAYILIAIYIPHFIESAPRWAYFVAAVLVFLYLMLDAMDGTQARRTNMASPMGELFDHLCDSLSLTLCVLLTSATMRLGAHESFFFLLMFFIPFYTSHWDNYNTGTLLMGKVGGPTDLLVLLTGVLVLTGITGSHIWLYTFSILGHAFAVNRIAVIVVALGSIISTISYTVHIGKNKDPQQSWEETIIQLLPYSLFLLICFGFLLSPYILNMYSQQFMLCIGCTNAYLVARLIVVRVTKEPVARFHIILVFLFLALVVSTATLSPLFPWNQSSVPSDDRYVNYVLLGVLLAYVFAQWVYFFGSVVRQLSRYLWIPIFTVKKEPEKAPLMPPQVNHGGAEV